MSDAAILERSYRRLLAWYPAAHRTTYGEEIIGVCRWHQPPAGDGTQPSAMSLT